MSHLNVQPALEVHHLLSQSPPCRLCFLKPKKVGWQDDVVDKSSYCTSLVIWVWFLDPQWKQSQIPKVVLWHSYLFWGTGAHKLINTSHSLTHTYTHTLTHKYTHANTLTHVDTPIHIHTRTDVHTYSYTHSHTYTCTYTHTLIHTHTPTNKSSKNGTYTQKRKLSN